MKAKRMTALVLATLILLTITPTAFSFSNEESTECLYIYSKKCPEEFTAYAKEMVGYLLWDYNVPNPSLGEAFTFSNQNSDIFYFPIFSEGKVVLTFRVYWGQNGKPTGVVSPVFAEDLNAIAVKTTSLNPLRIIYETRDNYDAVIFYMNDYEKETQITPTIENSTNFSVISGNDEFEIVNCFPSEPIQTYPSARTSKSLAVSIKEIQGKDNWCLAYCSSMILRYYGTYRWAEDIMKDIHGTNVSTITAMGKVNLIPYFQQYSFNVRQSTAYPSYNKLYADIVSEINGLRPLILHVIDRNDKYTHAIVARGYEDVKGTTSVWNPNHDFFETVVDLNHYTPAINQSRDMYVGEYWYNFHPTN